MKEIKLSTQFLEQLLTKGNRLNYIIEEGLENQDKIVGVHFDEYKKELILWCDTDKIIQYNIVCRRVEEK